MIDIELPSLRIVLRFFTDCFTLPSFQMKNRDRQCSHPLKWPQSENNRELFTKLVYDLNSFGFKKCLRLLHTSFLVFAMTDHFFWSEGGAKEAGDDSAITENWWSASFAPPSHDQQRNVIARRNDEAICWFTVKYIVSLLWQFLIIERRTILLWQCKKNCHCESQPKNLATMRKWQGAMF